MDEALNKLNLNDDFQVISDIPSIVKHGVMNPPAIMINGEIKIAGKIPTVEEVVEVIQQGK